MSYRVFEYAKSYFVTSEQQEVEQILESHSASLLNPDYRGSEDQIELSRILSKFALQLFIKIRSEEKKRGYFIPHDDIYNELVNNFITYFESKRKSTDPNNIELYKKHEDIFVEFIIQHAAKNTSINQTLVDLGDNLTLFKGIKEPHNILKIAKLHVPLSNKDVSTVLKDYKDLLLEIMNNTPSEKKDLIKTECKKVLIEVLKLTGTRLIYYPTAIHDALHSYEIDEDPLLLFEIAENWLLGSENTQIFDKALRSLENMKEKASLEKDEAKILKCEQVYVKLLELGAKQFPIHLIEQINNLDSSEKTTVKLAAQILQSHMHEQKFIDKMAGDLATYAHNASILNELISGNCPAEFSLILQSLNANPDVQLDAKEISWLTQTFSKLSRAPASLSLAPSSNQLAPAVWLKIFQCKNPGIRQRLTDNAFNILQDSLKLKSFNAFIQTNENEQPPENLQLAGLLLCDRFPNEILSKESSSPLAQIVKEDIFKNDSTFAPLLDILNTLTVHPQISKQNVDDLFGLIQKREKETRTDDILGVQNILSLYDAQSFLLKIQKNNLSLPEIFNLWRQDHLPIFHVTAESQWDDKPELNEYIDAIVQKVGVLEEGSTQGIPEETLKKIIKAALTIPVNFNGQALIVYPLHQRPNQEFLIKRENGLLKIVSNLTHEKKRLGEGGFGFVNEVGLNYINLNPLALKTPRTDINPTYALRAKQDILKDYSMLKTLHDGEAVDLELYQPEEVAPGITEAMKLYFPEGQSTEIKGIQPRTHLVKWKNNIGVIGSKAELGSLHDYIYSNQRIPLDFAATFKTLVIAVARATQLGIVNKDLKSRNMLVWNQAGFADVKLSDFGGAKFIYQTDVSAIGALGYLSEEDLEFITEEKKKIKANPQHPRINLYKVDMQGMLRSLGISMYELKNTITMQSILNKSSNANDLQKYNPLLIEMMEEDPFIRPNIVQVLKRIESIENPDLA